MTNDTDRLDMQPFASIVVVSYNTAAHIESCLLSLLQLDYPRAEIIVVDNGSTDGSVELIRSRFPDVELVELGENKGFAGGASVGLFMASGDILATVNPDVQLDAGWLQAMVETLDAYPDAGIVGSKIFYPDRRTLQHAGGTVHYPLATTEHMGRGETDHGQYDQPRMVSFVTGAALAMRRDVGRALSFFDESLYPVFFEDVDLCWRAQREGWRTLYQPKAVAYHNESVTYDRRSALYYTYYHANRLRFVVKHYTPEQVIFDFLPSEAARVTGDMPPEDRKASLALLDNRVPNGSNGHNHGKKAEPSSDATIQRRMEALQAHIGEVMGRWQVYERAGPRTTQKRNLSVQGRLRHLISRLYLWPTMRRQIEYNASTARTLREVSWQLADLQSRVSLLSLLSAGLVSKHNNALADLSIELDALRSRLEQGET